MRLAVKGILLLLAVYLGFLGGVAYWLDQSVRSLSATLMKNTARIIGNDIAAAISKSALEELRQGDSMARERLEEIVEDVTQRSEVVASLTVVDDSGKVVASDDMEAGKQLAAPDLIFDSEGHVEFVPSRLLFQGGAYHLFVPLLDQERIAGYLRLSISSQPIAALYHRARRELLLIAATGLLGVGVLGFVLHAYIGRRSAALTDVLERAMGGQGVEVPEPGDEFAEAVEVARRVGTQLTEAREKSSLAQRRLGALVKVVDVGVLLLRADHGLDFANGPARELLGYVEAGELERRWEDIRPLLEDRLDTVAINEAQSATVDLELPHDGQGTRVRLEVSELEEESGGGFLVMVKNRDMIDALETELGLAIQMRGLTRFYMGVVHDLKVPLQAMVMNLELLRESFGEDTHHGDPQLRERQARYLRVLREEIERLDRLLRTLLVHTAPPAEPRQAVDVCEIVRELVTLVGPQATQQRVTVDTTLPSEPILFAGHHDRLKQAMLNVVINALEAMPDGGRLSVDVERADGQVRIAFRDNGPGIPPELLPQIYKMHFTTKSGGTGTGLYVARSVVASHGGEIEVDSPPGGGTCFQIFLPLSPENV